MENLFVPVFVVRKRGKRSPAQMLLSYQKQSRNIFCHDFKLAKKCNFLEFPLLKIYDIKFMSLNEKI